MHKNSAWFMLINNMVWLVRFPNPLVKVASGSGNLTRCGNQHQALYGALELGWIQINFDQNLLHILLSNYLHCLSSHRSLYPPTFTFTILPVFVGGQEGRTFVLTYILAVLVLLLQRGEGHALGQGRNWVQQKSELHYIGAQHYREGPRHWGKDRIPTKIPSA